MAIKRSVDVIRAAAIEQRGFAAQVIDPPKLKAKFLEAAADLDRAADRLAKLEADGIRMDWIAANVGNIDFHVIVPPDVLATNPFIAIGRSFRDAVDNASAQLERVKQTG